MTRVRLSPVRDIRDEAARLKALSWPQRDGTVLQVKSGMIPWVYASFVTACELDLVPEVSEKWRAAGRN